MKIKYDDCIALALQASDCRASYTPTVRVCAAFIVGRKDRGEFES